MNCWKSIKFNKEFGKVRLFLISTSIGILTFIILYVPFSIIHDTHHVRESGIIPFIIAVSLLPSIHSIMHILPLIIMNKRVKVNYKRNMNCIPTFTYYTKTHVTKKVSLFVAISPTVFITLPGLIASFVFTDYYVYFLLYTCIHIGVTFIDFWFIVHVIQAPKKAYIHNENDGFDILLEAN
ncbi:DUF3267 domain-containing protein [Oceanobacillus bengalensis]|uniref:DUF3267 domain-containing protein n=1 Tax=Oceanobacillus bengalensis TaxID=1435466 RepID=A0A494Z9T0_9BACI|nr:DUF3267 domain-containing protein [Oceanobacillus bengalensis]RKQ18799.1 DUF3267 domain-containing protein [Oceanobacillus bengalensis]